MRCVSKISKVPFIKDHYLEKDNGMGCKVYILVLLLGKSVKEV